MRLFNVSHERDLPWWRYLVRSIAKYMPGAEMVSVVEDADVELFSAACAGGRIRVVGISSFAPEANQIGFGYLRQQYLKLLSDRSYPEGGHVQIDSDEAFVGPSDGHEWLAASGKAWWYYTPYAEMPANWPWRQPTERWLGMTVANEYLQRTAPWIEAKALVALRAHLATLGRPLFDTTLSLSRNAKSGGGGVPDIMSAGLSEYNLLGAFTHRVLPELYEFKQVPCGTPISGSDRWTPAPQIVPLPLMKNWSYGGMSEAQRAELERVVT